MDFFWPADDAAAAVRSRFDRASWQARVVAYRPVEVTTDGSDLVVVFRYGGHPESFAVRFPRPYAGGATDRRGLRVP
jgi:hypothetical protein